MREDYEWYKNNLPLLYEKYGYSIIAIKDKRVIGTYGNYAQALKETEKTELPGTFIIQKCDISEEAYTNYIASVNFA